MATDLLMTCHGRSAQDQGGQVLGWWADVSLSREGCRQAIRLGERLLETYDVEAIYASPKRRARETAEILSQMVKVVPTEEGDLRELDSGVLSSLTFDEAKNRYPDLMRHNGLPGDCPIPRGESYAELHGRVEQAVNRIVGRHPEEQVVVITHGGPIGAYLSAFLGYTGATHGSPPRFSCDAASLHHLRFSERERTVVRLNDTAHLMDLLVESAA